MQIEVKEITQADDLSELADRINAARWDAGNEIDEYSEQALQAYLASEENLLVAAFLNDGGAELAGVASARVALKPYGQCRWLYIDEVDTCTNHRRKGVGTALMRRLLTIARERNCREVWLGTEPRNLAANRLYRSLVPDQVEEVVGYTFRTEPERS